MRLTSKCIAALLIVSCGEVGAVSLSGGATDDSVCDLSPMTNYRLTRSVFVAAGSSNVPDYRITDDTIVNVMQVSGPELPPAVPEPAHPFLFAAGLVLLGAFSLLRNTGYMSRPSPS
ncbi:PEP-CTERM sorting domain-containing protein [Pseudoduganella sp. R-34]|uniref:PEP-CTERM sorting domain-containing protein n=1 Tax=unclassified Pseudoduganella TaxID=2637179 RepID=UPI003CF50C64